MPGQGMLRKLLERGTGRRKKHGRPRSRWRGDIASDIGRMNINNWKKKVKDRREWRAIVKQAMDD